MIGEATPTTTRLQMRLRDLRALQKRLAGEIAALELRLANEGRVQRRRGMRPSCGTEAGYQWHRYNERDNWPLPAGDQCGCRAAHREHARRRNAARRLEAA